MVSPGRDEQREIRESVVMKSEKLKNTRETGVSSDEKRERGKRRETEESLKNRQ